MRRGRQAAVLMFCFVIIERSSIVLSYRHRKGRKGDCYAAVKDAGSVVSRRDVALHGKTIARNMRATSKSEIWVGNLA